MPLIVHNHYHTNHYHFLPEQREQFRRITELLATIQEETAMIPQEVRNLMDQSRRSNDLLRSMDLSFRGLTQLVGTLQQKVAELQAGSVLSEADKNELGSMTSEMAEVFSSAQADITANTAVEARARGDAAGGGMPENVAGDLATAPRTDTAPGAATDTREATHIVDGNTIGSLAGTDQNSDRPNNSAPGVTAVDVAGAKTQGVGDQSGVGVDAGSVNNASTDGQPVALNPSPATGAGVLPGRDANGDPLADARDPAPLGNQPPQGSGDNALSPEEQAELAKLQAEEDAKKNGDQQ